MQWEKNLTTFGEKLYQLVERNDWSLRDFAAKIKYSHGNLSQIKTRNRPPPLKHVEHWADVLGLVGAEREYFLDLAALACCPPRVLRMFEPNHPAARAIQLAIKNDELKVAESPVAYDAKPPSKRGLRAPKS